MKRLDLTGERYGNLVALRRLPTTSAGASRWVLQCDCGNQTEALLSNLRKGDIKSCGCLGSRNTIGQRSLKHGHGVGFKKSRTAAAWRNAKTRCFNKANAKYPQYGGRGITMCEAWAEDFRTFLCDMGECPDGYTLERIRVNGNYEPGNCEWIPAPLQAKNKTTNIVVDGMILKDFAEKHGVSYKLLHWHIKRGKAPHEAADWLKSRFLGRSTKHNRQPSRI